MNREKADQERAGNILLGLIGKSLGDEISKLNTRSLDPKDWDIKVTTTLTRKGEPVSKNSKTRNVQDPSVPKSRKREPIIDPESGYHSDPSDSVPRPKRRNSTPPRKRAVDKPKKEKPVDDNPVPKRRVGRPKKEKTDFIGPKLPVGRRKQIKPVDDNPVPKRRVGRPKQIKPVSDPEPEHDPEPVEDSVPEGSGLRKRRSSTKKSVVKKPVKRTTKKAPVKRVAKKVVKKGTKNTSSKKRGIASN